MKQKNIHICQYLKQETKVAKPPFSKLKKKKIFFNFKSKSTVHKSKKNNYFLLYYENIGNKLNF